jgi:hypothetical protein
MSKMFNTHHKCTIDERGLCETCQAEERRAIAWKDVYARANNILHQPIPENLEEFPTPYEFGRMESGEWN